jgi:phosphomannomutase
MDRLRERLLRPPGDLADLAVIEVRRLDGTKMFLEDGSWLLLRASGAEPAVRLYAEAATPERLDRLVKAGETLIET